MKQVILARKDLKMSPGKLAAQVAHASSIVMWENISSEKLIHWMNGEMVKVVLGVNSRDEMLRYYGAAMERGIHVGLVLDAGRTELSGKNYTCLALGPDNEDVIDEITGKLKLY